MTACEAYVHPDPTHERCGLNCPEDCAVAPGDHGEPHGAGADYFDRPSAATNPEYWSE